MDNEQARQKLTAQRKKNIGQSIQAELGKIPPQAVDIEEVVLGALLIDKRAIEAISDLLRPEIFYKEAHEIICESILSMYDKGEPIDILTVSQDLRKKDKLEYIGGAFYLTELTKQVNSAGNIEFHCRILQEKHMRREVISVSSLLMNKAYNDGEDIFNLLDESEQLLFNVSSQTATKQVETMRSVIRETVKDIDIRMSKEGGLTGVPTGLNNLDRCTGGWQNSDLVIIAARPGMGKTALVLTMARNAAIDFKVPVAFFSLEMSAKQLGARLISTESELDNEKIKLGNIDKDEYDRMHSRIGRLTDAPIYIDDTPALSIREFRSKARRLKQQHKIGLIIVDYLQLMTAFSKGGNREQEIGEISRGLKKVAKELDVPVIALSQLSRAVETRGGDKRPQLRDLRESGSIEQDADMVSFLYRPEYYGIEPQDSYGHPLSKGATQIIIAKHRSGGLDNINLSFIPKFTKFIDYTLTPDGVPVELPNTGNWTKLDDQQEDEDLFTNND